MILRRAPSRHFTVVSNAVLNDARLSYEALGVLAFLLGRPDDWRVHIRQLCGAREKGGGRDRMYRIIGELIECGYVRRHEFYDPATGRVLRSEYVVSSEPAESAPETVRLPEGQEPLPENPDTADPDTANPTLPNNERYKEPKDTSPQPPAGAGSESEKALETGAAPFAEAQALWRGRRAAFPRACPDADEPAKAAWRRLRPDDRQLALSGIEPYYAALRKAKLDLPVTFATYLRERRWNGLSLPPAPAAARMVEIAPGTRAWWALFFRRLSDQAEVIVRGDGRRVSRAAAQMLGAARGGSGAWLAEAEALRLRDAELIELPPSGESYAAWRAALGADGMHVTDVIGGGAIWAPSLWPMEYARAA